MYRYIVANIETCKPLMVTDEIDGVIAKFKSALRKKPFERTEYVIKEAVKDHGFSVEQDWIIIDTQYEEDDFEHLIFNRDTGNNLSYKEYMCIIKKEIRNIKIKSIID